MKESCASSLETKAPRERTLHVRERERKVYGSLLRTQPFRPRRLHETKHIITPRASRRCGRREKFSRWLQPPQRRAEIEPREIRKLSATPSRTDGNVTEREDVLYSNRERESDRYTERDRPAYAHNYNTNCCIITRSVYMCIHKYCRAI